MRIALAQINATVGDLRGNKAKILEYIEKAQKLQADLVVFPEMIICGYPPEDLLYKDHFVKDNIKSLHEIAKEVKGITAVIGFVDRDKDKNLYNAAAVVCEGKIKGVYHKEELPNYGVFDEKRYFKPGKNHQIYSLSYDYFAVNICEDIWVDKSIYLKQSQQGASLLINISSSPYDMDKHAQREKLLKKRAQETNSFIAYVNLVGGQDELVFDGGSMIVNIQGKVIAQAKLFEEDLVVADISLSKARERKYKPFDIIKVECASPTKEKSKLSKISMEKLSRVEGVYKALVLGTRDYIQKNGFKKVLIGLSGGIDSSLVAAIAVDAIGKENVIGVTMPSRFTSNETKSDAKILAKNLNIKCQEVPIEKIFNSYLETLAEEFKGLKIDTAEENVQARIRGNILMAFSNKFGWLVLTTGNKSEIGVGYCTLYGDMSGGFAVIKDVPKTLVYELSEFVNSRGKQIIPQSVIKRAPTAELRLNQKDQDSLPPYEILDDLLERYVQKHESIKQMSVAKNEAIVKDLVRKIDLSEYKRRQAPPGVKITQRAFGKDWRLPITNKYKEY